MRVRSLIGFLMACFPSLAFAIDVCRPMKAGAAVSARVYDGRPEELSDLVADKAGKSSGYFLVGGVYERGRYVTITCEYADGESVNVELKSRVERCDYKYSRGGKALELRCR